MGWARLIARDAKDSLCEVGDKVVIGENCHLNLGESQVVLGRLM